MDEHDKAIAAARYIHSALVDANCSAFLWWGLAYAAPPAQIQDAVHRQKMRDEGLILVDADRVNGVNPFRERTPKYYTFKQFSRFIPSGSVRLETPASEVPLVAAFRSADARRIVLVFINPDRSLCAVAPRITSGRSYKLIECWLTDRTNRCVPGQWTGTLPAESVCTLVYQQS